MMNTKEMNRELTMEELETVSGAIFTEEMTGEEIEEHMLERLSYQNLPASRRLRVLKRLGTPRRISATYMNNSDKSYRFKYL